jgi:hypothetical protein
VTRSVLAAFGQHRPICLPPRRNVVSNQA